MHNSLMPNLMVHDVCETALFYQDIFGFKLIVAVQGGDNIVMALTKGQSLDWANLKLDPDDSSSAELMFQSRVSLEVDLPALKGVQIGASQTLYFA